MLIGRGRAADVYALEAHRVLRRYRTPYSCAADADLMRHLRQAGYPVPAVLAADGGDLVMEAARLRWLARQAGPAPGGVSRAAG